MGDAGAMRETRRSSRLPLSIPVEVSGLDAGGQEVQEKSVTHFVSQHGALISLNHRFLVGAEVRVQIPHLHREQTCRVIWVGDDPSRPEKYRTGVELTQAENFWGVQFPPEDWGSRK